MRSKKIIKCPKCTLITEAICAKGFKNFNISFNVQLSYDLICKRLKSSKQKTYLQKKLTLKDSSLLTSVQAIVLLFMWNILNLCLITQWTYKFGWSLFYIILSSIKRLRLITEYIGDQEFRQNSMPHVYIYRAFVWGEH